MLSGGHEAVKRHGGATEPGAQVQAAVSIETPPTLGQRERPDLARVTPDGRVVICLSSRSTALDERAGDRTANSGLIGAHPTSWFMAGAALVGHGHEVGSDGFMIAFARAEQAGAVRHRHQGTRAQQRKAGFRGIRGAGSWHHMGALGAAR